jgi:hypothetical protein
LQATLPPKPSGEILTEMGKATLKWKQQKITTRLKANVEGVRLAEAKALEISSLLRQNAFNWEPYYDAPVVELAKPLTVVEIVKRFEVDYFTRRLRTRQSESTWKTDYHDVFIRLPQDVPLDAGVINYGCDCLNYA